MALDFSRNLVRIRQVLISALILNKYKPFLTAYLNMRLSTLIGCDFWIQIVTVQIQFVFLYIISPLGKERFKYIYIPLITCFSATVSIISV